MTDDRSIPADVIEEMLRAIDPEWRLRQARPAERGFTAVYRVTVETEGGSRELVLKATPDGQRHGIDTEARLLAVLGRHTGIPVPEVIGVVDDRDGLPTPYFVMTAIPGDEIPYEQTSRVSDPVLRRVSRTTGEHLGELHAIEAVDSFGTIDCAKPEALEGGSPTGTPHELAVAEGSESWPNYLRAAGDRQLEVIADTRFDDLLPRLRPWVRDRISAMTDPFSSVVGRIDHGVHNLVIERESGEVVAVLDWGFTLAVTPGYDLQCVEYVLSGAVLAVAPGQPDRRELVREGIRDGYGSTAVAYPAEELSRCRSLYELLAIVRAMGHVETGVAKIPAGEEDAVARGLRRQAAAILEG